MSVNAELKRVFIEQIDLILWGNKIAPTTLNIPEGKTVKEIEVFTIRLNQRELDRRVMPLIDKEIPYHILFLLEYGDKMQAWIGYKEQVKNSAFKPETYYHTKWIEPEVLNLRLDGLDLDKVYENLIRQVAGERLGDLNSDIREAIESDERRKKIEREIAALEKKVQREKQFNKQIELNGELRRLKKELEDLGKCY